MVFICDAEKSVGRAGKNIMAEQIIYSPETIIKAYSCGVFPMAQSRDDPELRFLQSRLSGGVIPITPPHIPRRLIRFSPKTEHMAGDL